MKRSYEHCRGGWQGESSDEGSERKLTMQNHDDPRLAPKPVDPTAASTGAEAAHRDEVSTATAEALSIAYEQAHEHAPEHVCSPTGSSPPKSN